MSHPVKLAVLLVLIFATANVHAQEYGEWNQYENDAFSLAYPITWELTETDELITLKYEDYALNILLGDPQIGLPAGNFERRKLIGPYGIPVDVLVYEGKVKQVLYARVQGRDDTRLALLLTAQNEADIAYEDIMIPAAIVAEADQIVSSLRLHAVQQPADVIIMPFFSGAYNPIDAWQTYTHLTEPFGFRYPPTWTLQEDTGRIVLLHEDVTFTIIYASSTDQPPLVNPDLWNSDQLESRAAIYGLHQAIQSELVAPQADGTAAGVIYYPILTPDNHFVMWADGDSRLDPTTIDEIDLIISTFKTRLPQPNQSSN